MPAVHKSNRDPYARSHLVASACTNGRCDQDTNRVGHNSEQIGPGSLSEPDDTFCRPMDVARLVNPMSLRKFPTQLYLTGNTEETFNAFDTPTLTDTRFATPTLTDTTFATPTLTDTENIFHIQNGPRSEQGSGEWGRNMTTAQVYGWLYESLKDNFLPHEQGLIRDIINDRFNSQKPDELQELIHSQPYPRPNPGPDVRSSVSSQVHECLGHPEESDRDGAPRVSSRDDSSDADVVHMSDPGEPDLCELPGVSSQYASDANVGTRVITPEQLNRDGLPTGVSSSQGDGVSTDNRR